MRCDFFNSAAVTFLQRLPRPFIIGYGSASPMRSPTRTSVNRVANAVADAELRLVIKRDATTANRDRGRRHAPRRRTVRPVRSWGGSRPAGSTSSFPG